MKRFLFTLIVLALAGCSSAPTVAPTTPTSNRALTTRDQQLTSSFLRNGVKLEWSCKYMSDAVDAPCVKGDIIAMEAVGFAPTYGTTEALRETAYDVAHDVALSNLVRFIKQDISTSRVTKTLTKNIEKANDKITRKVSSPVTESDVEASNGADTNIDSTDTNQHTINQTVRTVVENIRSQSSGIVRGAQVINESVVDEKTVSVTIRWSSQNVDQSNRLQTYFK